MRTASTVLMGEERSPVMNGLALPVGGGKSFTQRSKALTWKENPLSLGAWEWGAGDIG